MSVILAGAFAPMNDGDVISFTYDVMERTYAEVTLIITDNLGRSAPAWYTPYPGESDVLTYTIWRTNPAFDAMDPVEGNHRYLVDGEIVRQVEMTKTDRVGVYHAAYEYLPNGQYHTLAMPPRGKFGPDL